MSKILLKFQQQKCFVYLTAHKDQNIFVLVILKNKRHLLDISKQYTHVLLNRLFRQAGSGADLHLFQTRFVTVWETIGMMT